MIATGYYYNQDVSICDIHAELKSIDYEYKTKPSNVSTHGATKSNYTYHSVIRATLGIFAVPPLNPPKNRFIDILLTLGNILPSINFIVERSEGHFHISKLPPQ